MEEQHLFKFTIKVNAFDLQTAHELAMEKLRDQYDKRYNTGEREQ